MPKLLHKIKSGFNGSNLARASRTVLIALMLAAATTGNAFAAKIPDDVKNIVSKDFPKTNFRFDGVIILPDNTIYLPVIPSKIINVNPLTVKSTIPQGKTLSQKPDAVIFNNDFVLLKVIENEKGQKSIVKLANPPMEIKTGLLPQDMLVPRGLIIPENLKGIIGNLEIGTLKDPTLKVEVPQPKRTVSSMNTISSLPALKNKTMYATTNFSKNILVVNPASQTPEYALAQTHIPISMKEYGGKFLLVTSYNKKSMDVISLADEEVIKQIDFKTQPDEIIIDSKNKIAYVASSEDASIYIIDLETMTFKKQLKLNGMCERLTLSEGGTKLFYSDKQTNVIWAIELDNNYLLKELGRFPNVSKIAYSNNKIYITSRTKNRLAIVDYATLGIVGETEITPKPVDMLLFNDKLYILGALDNEIQVIDTKTDQITDILELGTNGFSSKICRIEGTNLALVTDAKASKYSIIDLGMKKIISTNPTDVPINSIIVVDKVKKISK